MSQVEGDAPPVGALEDPELLAEIEAEFAELTAELERINALPRSMAPKKAELVKSLREQWFAKQGARPDRPEWRKKMDDALGEAISKILEDGIQETGDGRLEFALRNDSVQTHGGPLMEALLVGFRQMLTEKLAKPPQAQAAAPGRPAAPPNPLQGLLFGLGQMLAQALDNTQKSVAERKAADAEVKQREEGGKIKVEVTPGKDATMEVDVRDINASVAFDTRKGDAVPPILPEMFQSVVANLGKILNEATRPRAKKPTTAAPAPPDATEAAASSGEAAPAPGPEATPEPVEAPEPIEAPERAAAAATPAPEDAQAVAAPAAAVAEPAAPAQGVETAPPTPTLKVDFAGLLGQLFKLAPHGLATRRPEGDAPAAAPTSAQEPSEGDAGDAAPGEGDEPVK